MHQISRRTFLSWSTAMLASMAVSGYSDSHICFHRYRSSQRFGGRLTNGEWAPFTSKG